MLNGTRDLDAALEALTRILEIAAEEKTSIDYTHANAHLTGKTISEEMTLTEVFDFSASLKDSTTQSKENVEKILKILNISYEIIDHYAKLSEIGDVWTGIVGKVVDDLRYFQ
jgi:hypothetical protein